MPNPNVFFNGQSLILPGAYSRIDASQLAPGSLGLANVVAVLGTAGGGQPGVPLYFRSAETAKAVLRSGDLLEAIIMAYDPTASPDQGGADVVVAVRVNPATQSSLNLQHTGLTCITLTSRDYGEWTTGIYVKVEAGSPGGKKVTIKYTDPTLGEILEVWDNLADRAAIIAAINNGVSGGQAASAFVTAAAGADTGVPDALPYTPLAGGVDGVDQAATHSTLTLDGDTGASVILTSVGTGAWTNALKAKVEAGSVSGKKLTIEFPDLHSTTTEVYDNLADRAAFITALAASELVTATTGADTTPPVNVGFTNFSGGADATSAPTNTNWQNAFDALATEEVDIIVPLSTDPAITAMAKAHCETLSGVNNRLERVAIVGGAAVGGFGTTDLYVADLVSKAVTLNSSRVMLVAPGVKRPNAAGVLTTFGSPFLAAMIAGLAAAQEIGQTPTAKYVKAVGLDIQFTADQQETLILGGVCSVAFRRNEGFRIVQAVTTYQTDANPMYREFSVRRVGDYVMSNIRTRLEKDFTGARGDAGVVNAMLSTTVAVLERMKADRVVTDYRNVTVAVVSSVARVSFEFAPAEPINFVLITGFAKPASLAATFTGQATYTGATV